MVEGKHIKKAFGQTVKELRLAKNLSQEKLAEIANLDRSYISIIENGEKSATIITIYKLSMALDIKPSILLQEMEKHFKFE